MKKGEECGVCDETLRIGCEEYDSRFCELREKYQTDPNMGADDVILELTMIATPEQIKTIGDRLVEKGLMVR